MKKSRSFEELLEEILPPPTHPLYGQNKRYNLDAEKRGERIASLLSLARDIAGKKVLDVGCGTGGISVAFARRNASMFSLEPNDSHPILMDLTIARAEEAKVSINPVIARGEEIPFADGSFDMVILNDVIEHVQVPEIVVRESARVLRDDGLMYISTPNKYSFAQIVREGHSGLFGVTLLPPKIAALYATRIRKVSERYTVNKIHSFGAVRKYLSGLGLNFVLLNRYRPARHFHTEHPDCPKRYRSRLLGLVVWICRLPVVRAVATSFVTQPDLQPGFLEFIACRGEIPSAIQDIYRRGLAPGQSEV